MRYRTNILPALQREIFVLMALFAACSDRSTVKEERYGLHSAVKAVAVENNYRFCDSSLAGDLNCFLRYKGRRYLKKRTIYYDRAGKVDRLLSYQPEGAIEYSYADLLGDSLLVKTNDGKLADNVLVVRGDSVVEPNRSEILEFDKGKQQLYARPGVRGGEQEVLYIYEIW